MSREEAGSRRFVYVVDDDEAVRRSLRLLLGASGFEAQVFASGEEFLNALEALAFGCALLDLRMEPLEGIDVVRRMRARGYGWPAIVITGHGDGSSQTAALDAGAFALLEKPTAEAELLDALERAFASAAGAAGA